MQSASDLSGLSLPKDTRPGQEEVLKCCDSKLVVTAKLPTGYGKTRVFAGAYALYRQKGIANRMLYVVFRDVQVRQAASDIPIEMESFGVRLLSSHECDSRSTIVGDAPTVAMTRHRLGESEFFVVTGQSLATSNRVRDVVNNLLAAGKWFLAIDEYHNLPATTPSADVGKYFAAIKSLPVACELRMSATPKRDNDPYGEPDTSVSYVQAFHDKCVKELRLHEYEYRVDGVLINGEVVSYTTTELAENDEVEKMLLSGRMRWSPKYISPLITVPAERLIDLELRGIRSQMLVLAMNCSHAELIYEQIKYLLPNRTVEWVGTGNNGRSDDDNRQALHGFCPPKDKDGKRRWTVDVLVSVGMAAEGLDCTDVTEISFCRPCSGVTQSDMQAFGRGSRIMRDANNKRIDVPCHINVDTETDIAGDHKYVGRQIMKIFDEEVNEVDDNDTDTELVEREYTEMPEQPVVMIAEVELQNIIKGPMYEVASKQMRKDAPHWTDEKIEERAMAVVRQYMTQTAKETDALSERKQLTQQVDNAVSKVTSLILKRLHRMGMRFDRAFVGDLRKRINAKKGRVIGKIENCDVAQLRQHYTFCVELERGILLNENLDGVPPWLR